MKKTVKLALFTLVLGSLATNSAFGMLEDGSSVNSNSVIQASSLVDEISGLEVHEKMVRDAKGNMRLNKHVTSQESRNERNLDSIYANLRKAATNFGNFHNIYQNNRRVIEGKDNIKESLPMIYRITLDEETKLTNDIEKWKIKTDARQNSKIPFPHADRLRFYGGSTIVGTTFLGSLYGLFMAADTSYSFSEFLLKNAAMTTAFSPLYACGVYQMYCGFNHTQNLNNQHEELKNSKNLVEKNAKRSAIELPKE